MPAARSLRSAANLDWHTFQTTSMTKNSPSSLITRDDHDAKALGRFVLTFILFPFLANTWLYAESRVDHVDKSAVEMSIDRPRASLAYSFGTSSRPEKWACPILVVNEETFRESLSNTSACLDKHRLVSRVLVLFNWTRYQSAVEDPIRLQCVVLPPLLLIWFSCRAVKKLSKWCVFVINYVLSQRNLHTGTASILCRFFARISRYLFNNLFSGAVA